MTPCGQALGGGGDEKTWSVLEVLRKVGGVEMEALRDELIMEDSALSAPPRMAPRDSLSCMLAGERNLVHYAAHNRKPLQKVLLLTSR